MRKILFWFEDAWAFGAIHNSLAKELYKHDIYSNLLHWEYKVKPEEWKLLYDTYDLFVTKPDTAPILNSFGIPYEKMAVVAHGQWDYLVYKEKFGIDYYNKLYKFGAVSNILKQKASEFGIPRVPDVMPLGVHFDFYYNKPSTKLQSVGYGGAKQVSNFFGQEIKRGYLVEQIVKNHTPLTLIEHNNYKIGRAHV